MQVLPHALMPLAVFNQFILYKLVPKDNGKTNKLPVDFRTGQVFKEDSDWQNDPAAWTSADNAIAINAALGDGYGVGFFFTTNDPFFFLDIDNCLMPSGEWSSLSLDLIQRLPGTAVEISQSGKGLHIFGTGTVPEHSCKNIAAGLELYTEKRFVALTGTRANGLASTNCNATISDLVAHYFTPAITARGGEWTTEPLPEYTPFADNEKLLKKANKAGSAANKFGGKASFSDLWSNNIPVLAANYAPDASSDGEYDGSSADAALAQHLAFWTGCNCEHILGLMWVSGLVRDKWVKHKSYLANTITRAVSLQNEAYTGGKARVSLKTVTPPPPATIEPVITEGFQYLAATQQIEFFKGCVYVQDVHKIFIPGGALLKAEQFNATYGGYVFQLDGEASGKVTKKAWEAFTESQIVRYPKANSLCFRPDLESGSLITDEGRSLVNIYVPIVTLRQPGDPAPFLKHLAKILPNEQDRAILLAYMAALIQHKGVKFQWAPLIQGAEGNGKTLFTRCVAFAIGKRYTHFPKADDIDNKFNGWMLNKLFIGVEDIFVPDHRREVIEALKPMITGGDGLEIQLKGVDQITVNICANFMLNSNHKDAIRSTRNDRRFAVFFTAQQSLDDIIRDGMGGDYFPDLYRWLKTEGGYAIVASYLDQYVIPDELNPAGNCHRAPITSSTNEAIDASMGGIEQEVREAIEEGRPGFAGGWISSMAFERLLHSLNAARRIPPNKRRELLQSLGYDWHPTLHNGRVNNIMLLDGGKPRLFIKAGHVALNLTTRAAVANAYQVAQGAAAGAITAEKFSDER